MRQLLTLILAIAALAWSVAAFAHFKLNLNVRILHVEHVVDGLNVYLRLPMPYLVADKLGKTRADGLPEPAPFTTNSLQDGQVVHHLDPEQVRRDRLGLGKIAAQGHALNVGGESLTPRVIKLNVYARGNEPSFATIADAKASFLNTHIIDDDTPPYVGDSVVDVLVHYDTRVPTHTYAISSSLNPGLPGQEETSNLILDYGPGGTQIYRKRGLLTDPVNISRGSLAAIKTFITQGFWHIIDGLDHVLFVVCLVLGATSMRGLIGRITGFTIGHSVTLIAGFFGFVPTGAWFIPTVELGIALSIIYAASIALQTDAQNRDSVGMFVVTTAIGLLHGLGFSFVLHEILKINSPDLWQSLIAFNVGVELGQLAIVVVIWCGFLLLARVNQNLWRISRLATASVCILVAVYWCAERIHQLLVA